MADRSIRKEPVGIAYYVFAGGFFCLFVGLLAWKVTDHFTRPTVEITIDNALEHSVEVTLDGRHRGKVAPGATLTVPCRHGKRLLAVTRDGEPVFSLNEELPAPDKKDRPRQYLLNLGKAGRYRTYDAEYGASMRPNLPRIKLPFPGRDEKALRREELRELAEKIKLVELPEWSDVTAYDVIFQRPPKVVKGAITASKKVLVRVDAADYAVIKGAAAKQDPTVQDVEKVRDVVQRLLAEEAPGE